jgi:hypothetical protein
MEEKLAVYTFKLQGITYISMSELDRLLLWDLSNLETQKEKKYVKELRERLLKL